MRAVYRAWRMRQARRPSPNGGALYTIGQTTAGRPVLVDAPTWRMAYRDADYRNRLIRLTGQLDEERSTGASS